MSAVSVAGSYQAGSTALFFSHLTLNGPVTALGAVSADAFSELTLSPAAPQTLTVPSLSLTRGSILDGSDGLIISGLFTWGGSLETTGTVTAAGEIITSGSPILNTTLVNLGAAMDAGVDLINNAHIDNQGTWEFVTDGRDGWGGGAAPLFTNEGQIVADGGNSGVNVRFVNTGTVTVHGGTFLLGNQNDMGTSSTTSDLVADPGANLELDGNVQVSGNIQADNVTFGTGANAEPGYGAVTVSGSVTAAGQVYVDGDGTGGMSAVSVAGSYQAGSTVLFASHLTLNGPATALGAVSADFFSELTLGPTTPQTMTVATLSLTRGSTITLNESIGGNTAGSQYSQLVASGNIDLSGNSNT